MFSHPGEKITRQEKVNAVTARLNGNTQYFITLHKPDGTEVARKNLGNTLPRLTQLEFTNLGAGVISFAYVHGPDLKLRVLLAEPCHLLGGETLNVDFKL